MKLDIPKFRYLFQDYYGDVIASCDDLIPNEIMSSWRRPEWFVYIKRSNRVNQNWLNTRIDLETDDYEFEDGILRRIEK